jgi:hypothetical protein
VVCKDAKLCGESAEPVTLAVLDDCLTCGEGDMVINSFAFRQATAAALVGEPAGGQDCCPCRRPGGQAGAAAGRGASLPAEQGGRSLLPAG